MIEEWRPVKDYEGMYEVSNMGQVKSLDRAVIRSDGQRQKVRERILSQEYTVCGYPQVYFSKDGKGFERLVHRLVAEAFIPNPYNLPQVNHKDENKQNNRVDNLEWCTLEYNVNYGARNKRVAMNVSKPVNQFSLAGRLIKAWDSMTETERYGFGHSSVSACCRGKQKTHAGYVWRYAE